MIKKNSRIRMYGLIAIALLMTGCTTNTASTPLLENTAINIEYGAMSGEQLESSAITEMAQYLVTEGVQMFWQFADREQVDRSQIVTDSNGANWYLATNYHTVVELKAAAENLYTKELCDNVLYRMGLDKDHPKYKEIGKKLYATDSVGGMGVDNTLALDSIVVIAAAENEIEIGITKFHLIEETEEQMSMFLKRENDKWLLATMLISWLN